MTHRTRNAGFTLVEILIVVVILGILAAIVIPQFTSASESARASSLVSQLQTIRGQLELYQVQHNGSYPDLSSDWDQLTAETNVSGNTPAATDVAFGPYLQKAPMNAFENSTSTAAAAAAGVGWVYSSTAGTVYASMETDKSQEVGLTAGASTDDVLVY